MFQDILLLYFCRFLMIILSVVITRDMYIFKIYDIYYNLRNVFYLKAQYIL